MTTTPNPTTAPAPLSAAEGGVLDADLRWLREREKEYRGYAHEMYTDVARAEFLATADTYARIIAALERWEKMEAKAALLSRTVDRYLPCPDHRDKVDGSCYVCAAERARRERDAALQVIVRDVESFTRYFIENYPSGSVISNPAWHASRIYRAAVYCVSTTALGGDHA